MSELPRGRAVRDKPLEILAVLLLGIATIGTAWCGYQASQWNDQEGALARDASDALVEASRLFGLATQTISYDTNVIAQYGEAVSNGDEELQTFIRESLMRAEFEPVLSRWQEQVQAGQTPENLLEDEEYLAELADPYQDAEAQAATFSEEGRQAGETGDAYILTTLLLASALFFAGVMPSFRARLPRVLLLVGATACIAFAASRLVELPVLT